MKLEKSLLIMIAAAVTIGVAAPSCSKEKMEKKREEKKAAKEREKALLYGCPGCGMG
ncbi:hypothetical protein U0035_06680 [Niabella yanshanensis]|uniref:Uncharacterized protein n=1 Tax=Niabella yanshanensis TaxID=577386 RepID=A0ABZ0W991_9BACT|nr:hypothetical protein [Niabella yanshanensis]WQD39832.1 hypothetical protein U0035_06680 [Niabella yanshanensis]